MFSPSEIRQKKQIFAKYAATLQELEVVAPTIPPGDEKAQDKLERAAGLILDKLDVFVRRHGYAAKALKDTIDELYDRAYALFTRFTPDSEPKRDIWNREMPKSLEFTIPNRPANLDFAIKLYKIDMNLQHLYNEFKDTQEKLQKTGALNRRKVDQLVDELNSLLRSAMVSLSTLPDSEEKNKLYNKYVLNMRQYVSHVERSLEL
jgi:hypothetical protein